MQRSQLSWIHVVGATSLAAIVVYSVLHRRAQLREHEQATSDSAASRPSGPPPDPIVYTPVVVTTDPLPARFSAGPGLGDGADDAHDYPRDQVFDALCTDQDSMRARFLAALDSTSDAELEKLPLRLLLHDCTTSSFCGWGVASAIAAKANARQALLALVAQCEGADVDALFAAGDVSPMIAEWRTTSAARKTDVASVRIDDPHTWLDLPAMVAGHGKEAVEAALVRCVEEAKEVSAPELCLAKLADLDRPRALVEVDRIDRDARLWFFASPVVQALAQFPAEGAFAAHLTTLGLLGPSLPTPLPSSFDLRVDHGHVSAWSLLHDAGRALSWDAEWGEGGSYAALVRSLAAIARPALDGAYFAEDAAAEGHGALRAWVDGKRFDAEATDAVWFSAPRAVGFVNALLRARGATTRVLALTEAYGGGSAMAGPEASLRTLVEEKLAIPDAVPTPLDEARKEMLHEVLSNLDAGAP